MQRHTYCSLILGQTAHNLWQEIFEERGYGRRKDTTDDLERTWALRRPSLKERNPSLDLYN